MDIQFVLDAYACAMYIVSYISKAQKGMSELLCKACAEAREGNANIKQQVHDIGNKFFNSVEISAQEAVHHSSTSGAEVLKKCYIYQHISPCRMG